MKLGQLQGHLLRVLDHSNVVAQCWVPVDWPSLCGELRDSGWRGELVLDAFDKILMANPCLENPVSFTKRLLGVVFVSDSRT